MAARQASLASRSAAERAAAAAIRQERHGRLAVLEQEALPLLRGIADGTLDPADGAASGSSAPGTRRSCGTPSPTQRRRRRAGGQARTGAAGRRGARAAGDRPGHRRPGTPPPPVARAVLATVDAVLSALPPHQVVLTVLAAGEDVELYLTFSAPLRAAPDLTRFGLDLPAAARWHAALSTDGNRRRIP